MNHVLTLRSEAEHLAGPMPPLLAEADHLASTVLLGEHGRRRAGLGDAFWQYRPAQPGDEARLIDWRRSARSDQQFVQDKEWQIAQSVMIWVDQAAAMRFASSGQVPTKAARARSLALATAILLLRGGERVGLTGFDLSPKSGEAQILRLAEAFSRDVDDEYGVPEARGMTAHSRALFVSDFLGDVAPAQAALTKAADRGVKGALLMVLDPQEEAFPFNGRTIFESMGGGLRHETLQADDLKDQYLERLAARKEAVAGLARTTGWQFHCHHTDAPAQSALLWLYQALGRQI